MTVMDLYFITIYYAIVLQCKMAVIYASLPNEMLVLATVLTRN